MAVRTGVVLLVALTLLTMAYFLLPPDSVSSDDMVEVTPTPSPSPSPSPSRPQTRGWGAEADVKVSIHDMFSSKLWPDGVKYHRVWYAVATPPSSSPAAPPSPPSLTVVFLHHSAGGRGDWLTPSSEAHDDEAKPGVLSLGSLQAVAAGGLHGLVLDLPGGKLSRTPPLLRNPAKGPSSPPTSLSAALSVLLGGKRGVDPEVFPWRVREAIPRPFVLVAAGDSAPLAVRFALDHPDMVDALVLAGPEDLVEDPDLVDAAAAKVTAKVMLVSSGNLDQAAAAALRSSFAAASTLVELELADAPLSLPHTADPGRFNDHLVAFLTGSTLGLPSPSPKNDL